MLDFATISRINMTAFKNNSRSHDLIAKKREILDTIAEYHNLSPVRILFMGFSSFVMTNHDHEIAISCIDTEIQEYLQSRNIPFRYIPEIDLINYNKQFDVVVAVDEYFTYADTDQNQKDLVKQISNLATGYVITTLRDYKNQDYKDREFSQPSIVKNNSESMIFLESHDWSNSDRANWISTIYAIDQVQKTLVTHGGFARRTMYFKQLANFSTLAGAEDFTVHKNLMYKGLIKKNYEHVITITFN